VEKWEWELLYNGHRVSVWVDGTVPVIDSGDDCPIL
jgi:hypothetical protein